MKYFGFFSAFLLASCGFHLRGIYQIPANEQPVFIEARPVDPALVSYLHKALFISHVRETTTPRQAHTILLLEQDSFTDSLNQVSASTTPRQYQINYLLSYQYYHPATPTRDPQHLMIQRSVTLNNDHLLGSDFEKHTLQQEMEHEAIAQLLLRITAPAHP